MNNSWHGALRIAQVVDTLFSSADAGRGHPPVTRRAHTRPRGRHARPVLPPRARPTRRPRSRPAPVGDPDGAGHQRRRRRRARAGRPGRGRGRHRPRGRGRPGRRPQRRRRGGGPGVAGRGHPASPRSTSTGSGPPTRCTGRPPWPCSPASPAGSACGPGWSCRASTGARTPASASSTRGRSAPPSPPATSGFPALAISIDSDRPRHLDTAATVAASAMGWLLQAPGRHRAQRQRPRPARSTRCGASGRRPSPGSARWRPPCGRSARRRATTRCFVRLGVGSGGGRRPTAAPTPPCWRPASSP